ncbi:TetR/AcrR family transcriptional regulator [Actinomadura atramentaria]|uniref:TetR/AcrR family transcriptional regulator n=1 Tax=Actinomadura atramentaria TaxID=1990 RepID=UPI00036E0386|nr:TetR/AcrR family transcriptional regulator [Actinomadura atramentaria]
MHTEDDLTARARIRDAALREFAEHGVKGATIRGIARAAGVSPGLVQHHFGTKDGLRAACDEYTVDVIRTVKRDALDHGVEDPGVLGVAVAIGLPIQRYLARSLVDGSPGAAALFDDSVAVTTDLLDQGSGGLNRPDTDDLPGYAAVLTAMSFGLVVLHEHLGRALGADPLTPEGYPRMALAVLDVFGEALVAPEMREQARAAIAALTPPASTPGGPPGGPPSGSSGGTPADPPGGTPASPTGGTTSGTPASPTGGTPGGTPGGTTPDDRS